MNNLNPLQAHYTFPILVYPKGHGQKQWQPTSPPIFLPFFLAPHQDLGPCMTILGRHSAASRKKGGDKKKAVTE